MYGIHYEGKYNVIETPPIDILLAVDVDQREVQQQQQQQQQDVIELLRFKSGSCASGKACLMEYLNTGYSGTYPDSTYALNCLEMNLAAYWY